MILGVSHLTLAAINFEVAIAEWQAKGYQVRFQDRGVRNAPEKKRLLQQYTPAHDLCTLHSSKGGLPIEVIQHGNEYASGRGRYELESGHLSLLTGDLGKTREFWTNALRFRDSGSDTLALRSPVPNWGCKLKLSERQGLPASYLDSSGFTCLALLCRNIASDAALAAECGATDMAGPFALLVDGKPLQVAIFRSPTGELCELVQIEGKND